MPRPRTGKQTAFITRANFIAKIVSAGNLGYNCEDEQGNIIKGVVATTNWPINTWVTIVKTADGLSILGSAGTGPGQVYES